MKLCEVLKKHTIKELKDIAKSFSMKGYSRFKKDELVTFIEKTLLTCEVAEPIFLCAQKEEMELFRKALIGEVKLLPEQSYLAIYFYLTGFYDISNQNSIIIPDEIKELYSTIFAEEFMDKKKRFDLVMDYCVAASNLYGIVPMDKVIELFNKYNIVELTQEEFLMDFEMANTREMFCYLVDGYLVHEALETQEDREHLLITQRDLPYYEPAQEELLKYADDSYFERTKEYLNLKEYLLKNVVADDDMAEILCDNIQLACCFGEGPQDVVNEFISQEVEFKDEKQIYDTGHLISLLFRSTRMWKIRGYTIGELVESGLIDKDIVSEPKLVTHSNTDRTFVRSKKKVSRNDPCPCGSGKKYKYCCGK